MVERVDQFRERPVALGGENDPGVARVNGRQRREVAYVEGEETAALSGRPEQLLFITGIFGHPLARSSRDIVAAGDEGLLARPDRGVRVEVQLELRHNQGSDSMDPGSSASSAAKDASISARCAL